MLNRSLIKHVAFFGLTLLSLQGTIYLLQILAAAQMTNANYSQVRVVESLVAVLALISTIGIPSVGLVKIANSKSTQQRKLLIRNSIILVGIFIAIISLAFVCVLQLGLLQLNINLPIPLVLTLAAFISFRLLLVNTTQALQKFRYLAIVSMLSCIATIAFFELTKHMGWSPVLSWIWARIILEAIVCLGLLLIKFNFKSHSDIALSENGGEVATDTPKTLFFAAFPIGVSLILRSVVEHGPILWLASINAPVSVIAKLGFILTLGTIALMPSGILQGVILPRLSIVISEKTHDKNALIQLILLFIVSSAATAMLFIILAGTSLFFIPLGKFITGAVIIAGVLIVTSKVVASALGSYLLASNQRSSILAINFFTLMMFVLAALIFKFEFQNLIGLMTLLWIIASIETCAATCYIKSAFKYKIVL